MASPFLGEIRMFGGNYAPRGYAACDGQSLDISQNEALFSLLGTTFGGNGVTAFNLPDLRGRAPVHQGQSPGTPAYVMGQVGGSESVTLTQQDLAAHDHLVNAVSTTGNTTSPASALLAATTTNNELYAAPGAGELQALDAQTIQPTGGGLPHDNMMPFLTVMFIIALEGVYPPRD